MAFVYPNPKHRARYVLVTRRDEPTRHLRAIALPELLPDFIVYDDKIAPARGAIILGAATPLAAGLFRQDWSLSKADLSSPSRLSSGATR